MVGGNNTFAKTICSICYEDLKPIVEDLQSISVCGHVFHELCIQQWFEYCPKGKKKNCPICKQACSESGVSRLYFQSVGDPNDPSLSKKPRDHEENQEELREDVRRLEGKVLGLTSALNHQQNDLRDISEELCLCKEQLKKEAALKDDALKKTRTVNQLLHLKSEELDKSTLECMRLQDRNMALAKELAALKLVSDVNLEEEEILKLASLGTEANNKETIDVLKKSLVIRNKSYKELIVKCNALGRGEACSLNKLEKAKEKIRKLKARVQELETVTEAKDNEVLRALRAFKKTTIEVNALKSLDPDPKAFLSNMCTLEDKIKEPALSESSLDQAASMSNGLFYSRKTKRFKSSKEMGTSNNEDNIIAAGQGKHSYFLIDDDDASEVSKLHEFSSCGSLPRANEDATTKACHFSRPGVEFHTVNKAKQHEPSKSDKVSGSRSTCKGQTTTTHPTSTDEDVMILDEITQDEPLLNITKETSLPHPISQEGDFCFAGGLLGPDGTKWHLGKWCKRGPSKGLTASSASRQGSGANTGDLIAEGADGRGGRIKLLRSLNPSSLDGKETSTWAKKCKYGAKTNSLQSKGCLQIDHFFARAGQK